MFKLIDGPGQLMTRTACIINYFFVFCSHSALSADSAYLAFVSCRSTVKIVISTLLIAMIWNKACLNCLKLSVVIF